MYDRRRTGADRSAGARPGDSPGDAGTRLPPALAWLGLAVLVRGLTALYVAHPGYIDAYYAFHVATNLLSGRGLVEDILWNYLSPPETLPRPSNAYWPPGTAWFVAAGSWLAPSGLPAWRRAQVAPVLGSAFLVAGAFAMTLRQGSGLRAQEAGDSAPRPPSAVLRRRAHVVAGLLLFSGVYFPYWVTTDGFTPFALAGGASLWLAVALARSSRRRGWLAAGAGLAAGLAQCVRPDGFLLLVAPLLASLVEPGRAAAGAPATVARRRPPHPLLASGTRTLAPAVLGAYVAGAAPWLIRNWLTWGAPAPPGAGGALWLREYDELFAFAARPAFAHWLDAGIGAALTARAGALWQNLGILGQPLLYYPLPATVAGIRKLWGRPILWVPGSYLLALYGLMSLVFPFAGVRGGLFHSLAAVLPFLFLWTVVGVEELTDWAARRRRWPVPQAQRVFGGALVAFGALASGYFGTQLPARWNERLVTYRQVAAWLQTHDPGAGRVMVIDPPGFWYASGRSAVVTPSDGFAALIGAAVRYDVRYVLLEPAAPRYLAPVYDGSQAAPDLEPVATVGAVQLYRVAPPPLPGLA